MRYTTHYVEKKIEFLKAAYLLVQWIAVSLNLLDYLLFGDEICAKHGNGYIYDKWSFPEIYFQ